MKKTILFVIMLFAVYSQIYSQDLWKQVSNPTTLATALLKRDSEPKDFRVYTLDMQQLQEKLSTAPSRFSETKSQVIISFPDADGVLKEYRIYEASVMEKALAEKHPDMQSYIGKGISDPTATIRFSTTIFGLHVMKISGNGTSYIDPYTTDLKNYIVYGRDGLLSSRSHFCGVKDFSTADDSNETPSTQRSNNSLFKTYRMAMACTTEYAAFHINAAGLSDGTIGEKKAAVLAAMNVTVTRLNTVYEIDLAVTMVLVANNENIIFIDSDTFDNNDSNALIEQSQTVIDSVIGNANYDIGHTVSTGGGGLAQSPSVCSSSVKAMGITGLGSPVGDPFDIDYVAHEVGHQFGGSHTFNSDDGSCSGNRSASSAFEPGSGTTIMAYAGICAPDNVQLHSDAYFHTRSLTQMQNVINGSGNCGVAVPNGNLPPVINAAENYVIPVGTAFVLRGAATDPDNDGLTYCWEQFNNNISPQPPLPTSLIGPNFRSYPPTASPERHFPRLSDQLANNLTPTWEVIPTVARQMVFSLVVRDNGSPLGGQTERTSMTLRYAANTGPFKVTSQNSVVAWQRNTTEMITWDVAGTDGNGINTTQVNIRLSTDGGLTFPYLLAENTPNDGSQTITVPEVTSQNCRVRVEAVGNVFAAMNAAAFLIGYEIVDSCNTYTYSGEPFSPVDGTTVYTIKSFDVAETGIVGDVNVSVNATHPNIQNLGIAIIRPSGSLNMLYSQQCPGVNMDVTFDNQAADFVCGSPLQGRLKAPSYNLDLLNGTPVQGTWRLAFRDMVAGNVGTINSFSVEICARSIQLATDDFNFKDFALFPNPNSGTFTIQFKSVSGNQIRLAVHDLSGRKIFDQSYHSSGLFSENLQLTKAQSGVYLVSVTDGDKKIVKRIVVK